ncbi:ATPase (PilT family) [Operophtera brumata]|uniref:ATPase (PilT family) n=1 Tax=Operophtera brumata TaxID=104452 RepID=A0A0L7L7F3_OPEBR|nr:ATPase (PilT family) [Operophtera brumata]
MELEDSSPVNECENLMNVVVESRKRFGKMCVEYEQKTSLMENKILNYHIETFASKKFKPKNYVTTPVSDDSKEIEDFSLELIEISKRFEDVRKKVKDTQEVVLQLKNDIVKKRLREPLSVDAILAKVKVKKVS